MARKATEFVQFKLRIRESLRRKIERAAEKRAHSANAEAVWRIERTFAQEEDWAANHKVMEEREKELREQHRQWVEQEARKEALFEASLRDTKILNLMVGGETDQRESAKLLGLVAFELAKVPFWASTPQAKKTLADRIRDLILNNFPPNE